MSNIYIQEPPTIGKVLLKTTVGDIDIELWSKETPKACRNFIQLCLEAYYNNTIFHRVVKGFIVQGGDPTGTGGESIYGQPFKDEFHTRLRFNRRGLVAMANAGKDDNGSQFFFTFAAAPELQNKHTIFGKVTGETIYNLLKLEEVLVDEDEQPLYPQKIFKAKVLNNPFPDVVPRRDPAKEQVTEVKKKEKTAGVKNFKLLSFGVEAEEHEEESEVANKMYAGRSKSTHYVLNDPKLSAVPTVDMNQKTKKNKNEVRSENDEDNRQPQFFVKQTEARLLTHRQFQTKHFKLLKVFHEGTRQITEASQGSQ
ncbi:spliceosome-associated protein CWC27 homolog [Schistocerca gregaria]|uniref:spliceosome-associated protein CWC27 homolog n=1 Tax=Schistocerca gregaria TaxID=7010 RepID=UPI00211E79BB|nr:spliceosome-associated protein CWC27 homolog [Schistocerca gregaria]